MKNPDPSDFTGKKTPEKDEEPEGNILTKTGGRIKDKAYDKLGIKTETGNINKKRRNIIAAIGGGVGTGVIGYQAVQGSLGQETEGPGEMVENILEGGNCEETGYEITRDIVEEHDIYQVGAMEPVNDSYYIARQTPEHGWVLEGIVPTQTNLEAVDVEDEKIDQILSQSGEKYEEGEEIVEYCLD